MLSRVNGAALIGLDSHQVQVEVDVTSGFSGFNMVGLPGTGVKESKIRVKSAIRNSDYKFPGRRVHVNLAPADIKKAGPSFDLPLALALLEATEQLVREKRGDFIAVGELSLDGRIRAIRGALSIAIGARDQGASFLVMPEGNAQEAALAEGLEVYGVSSLREAASLLEGNSRLSPVRAEMPRLDEYTGRGDLDLADVRGQEAARRALEVAAAGGHNMLMVGPPGSGKSMLALRLPGILPPLALVEALEVTRIHSVAGLVPYGGSLVARRPFRNPHNTISGVGLTGGGVPLPKPGEVSLAHRGVLYLDELNLYARNALELLRGPLEDRRVTIVRSMVSVTYPARFMLVGSMNPCPCGFLGDPRRPCSCSAGAVLRYRSRISGPLLDRIDIQIEVPRLTPEFFTRKTNVESSRTVRDRVVRARTIQEKRWADTGVYFNAEMSGSVIEKTCQVSREGIRFLRMAVEKLGLSARSYHKVLKVGKTIADLSGNPKIEVEHLAEATQYRSFERALFCPSGHIPS